jgi:cellobiose epimerase
MSLFVSSESILQRAPVNASRAFMAVYQWRNIGGTGLPAGPGEDSLPHMNSPLLCLNRRWIVWRMFRFVIVAMILSFAMPMASAADLAAKADHYQAQLKSKILPYWLETGVDRTNGGYLLNDEADRKAGPPSEKQLVTQARMVWGFSLAHRKGYGDAGHDYLQAAGQGYRFIRAHFYDADKGGYYWTTDLAGTPRDTRKIVYGEAFVIYAFVEYYRASGEVQALSQAMDLYHVLQKHAHETKNGGWIEHFDRDWTPILKQENIPVEVGGYKSANTHLHLMEALTELYEATRDDGVRLSLAEALRINAVYFYPAHAAEACFHRQFDWQPVTAPSSAGLSYGHNVEFAWLMVRAEKVLGREPSWGHFNAYLEHALKYGYDHQRGGLYSRGVTDQPATDTEKVWWVQAEMLAALTDSLARQPNSGQAMALEKLIAFVDRYQTDPKDGIWLQSVTAEGQPKSASKANNWKANYHDVRALVKFIEAFSNEPAMVKAREKHP